MGAAAHTGILTISTASHTVILGASSAMHMGVLRLTIAILMGGALTTSTAAHAGALGFMLGNLRAITHCLARKLQFLLACSQIVLQAHLGMQ